MDISNAANLNAARMTDVNLTGATYAAKTGSAILEAQQDGWSVTPERGNGIAVAGEEAVDDAALSRNDDLGQLIGKAYGISV